MKVLSKGFVLCFRTGEIRSDESVQLPKLKEFKAKKACLNIQNNDKKCFLSSILASLHPVQHNLYRVSKYQEYEHELNMTGIQYPVDIKDIGKFEHQNNISVKVYGYEDKKIFPLRITTTTVGRHHVNLFYITTGEKSHYALVKELTRLASSQYNDHNGK